MNDLCTEKNGHSFKKPLDSKAAEISRRQRRETFLESRFGVYGLVFRETLLTRVTGAECQTEPLGDSYTSDSEISCFVRCVSRYSTTCQSIVYNDATKICTPGAVAFRPLEFISTLVPTTSSPDGIYYAKQPIPTCDTAGGNFELIETCGYTACIHKSTTRVTYAQALSDCDLIGAKPLMLNYLPNYSVCRYNTFPDHYWVGLQYSDPEAKFIWRNGDPLSDKQFSYIWVPGQPNNNGGQNCAEFIHVGINDISCMDTKMVICEAN
ncbi:CD209 antigen [Elysia marginata]|uniref:CD209 antigen n=1 Tax=Elysia marginata TaxID=1093978 RepID=A0AAV4FDK7_9GAST|nr:CD209 antigen [Elysia marginata]